MSFDLDRILRRLKPEKHSGQLTCRPATDLQAIGQTAPKGIIIPDTTAYIHAGQRRLPAHIATMVTGWPLQHCSVCLSEIAHALGRLDPQHPKTPQRKAYFEDLLRKIPEHRINYPDHEIHVQAGIVTGILARRQGLPSGAHRKHINDILILLTARKIGAAVITANVGDFDLIQQIIPDTNIIFY